MSGGADCGKAAGAGRRVLRPQGLRPKAVRIRLGVETRDAVLVTYRAVQAAIAVYLRSMPLISQEFVYTRSRVAQPEAPLRYRSKHPRHDVSALVLRKMGGSLPYPFVGIFNDAAANRRPAL